MSPLSELTHAHALAHVQVSSTFMDLLCHAYGLVCTLYVIWFSLSAVVLVLGGAKLNDMLYSNGVPTRLGVGRFDQGN